ncbi:MAG: GNAT family N-acetyltransferase [Bacteroidales bacterium]|nr:GNAT family N-acetyltransferase [Bacteroidales bacterium]
MDLTIKELDNLDCLKEFKCGVEQMDKFIQNKLWMSIENCFCRAYGCYDEKEALVAFYALSFDSLNLDDDAKEDLQLSLGMKDKEIAPHYQDTFFSKGRYPAMEIAYLAINEDYRNQGLGRTIIEAIVSQAETQTLAGCQFLTVEALVTPAYSAIGFYSKCGFEAAELRRPYKDTLLMFRPVNI